jgi:hypothetical protein
MLHPNTHVIKPEDRRNGQGEDHCFYCKGVTEHGPECVLRRKTVVIRKTVDYVVAVPEFWSPDEIEFHRNEGTRCGGNDLHELAEIIGYDLVKNKARQEQEHHCGCFGRVDFVRDATPDDLKRLPVAQDARDIST